MGFHSPVLTIEPFFDAAKKQHGPKIAPTKIPLPVIVVDTVDENPSAAKAGGSGETPSGSSDPISLQDAIQQQLGLKLEVQKRPMTVLVIDHINETPTEN